MNDVTRVTPAQGFGDTLMQLLSNPDVPADKLQIMLQMQREILADRRREAFETAFVAMHAKMPRVNKHGLVELIAKDGRKLGSYKFAKWEDMDEVLRPHLEKFGFALRFTQINGETGLVTVRGELVHIDGHSVSSERAVPPDRGPGRNDLQAIGSSISYAKRYLAEGLCNIVRQGEDNDGQAIPKPISAAQVKELEGLLKSIKTSPQTFLRFFVTGADALDEIQERDFPRLINALKEKQRSMEK